MGKVTYFAKVVNENHIDISLCDEIPDFIHAIKVDHHHRFEVVFDVDSEWTSLLEESVMNRVLSPIPA